MAGTKDPRLSESYWNRVGKSIQPRFGWMRASPPPLGLATAC